MANEYDELDKEWTVERCIEMDRCNKGMERNEEKRRRNREEGKGKERKKEPGKEKIIGKRIRLREKKKRIAE
jgi:hypothetical protein